MSKMNFLNNVLDVIFFTLIICLFFTGYNGHNFQWFVTFFTVELFIILTGVFVYYKIIGKTKIYNNFTTHFKLKYSGNLNELINDFITCDLYFHKQIGSCYIFSSKRFCWHNQKFCVEKINDFLQIQCNQYSFNQLKQHPASFILTGKVHFCTKNKENNSYDEFKPIFFDKGK